MDAEFSVDQWDKAIQAMPNMIGFSGFDGPLLEKALARLPQDQWELVVAVLEKGGRLHAAKALAEENAILKIIEKQAQITAALTALRKEFEKVMNL